VVNSC